MGADFRKFFNADCCHLTIERIVLAGFSMSRLSRIGSSLTAANSDDGPADHVADTSRFGATPAAVSTTVEASAGVARGLIARHNATIIQKTFP